MQVDPELLVEVVYREMVREAEKLVGEGVSRWLPKPPKLSQEQVVALARKYKARIEEL